MRLKRRLPDPVTLHGYTFTFEWVACGVSPITNATCYDPFKLIQTKRTGLVWGDSTRVGFCREHGQPFSADVTLELVSLARDQRARSDASEASDKQCLKDARLMAAAPTLLAAAADVLHYWDKYIARLDGADVSLHHPVLSRLHYAIDAATREEK